MRVKYVLVLAETWNRRDLFLFQGNLSVPASQPAELPPTDRLPLATSFLACSLLYICIFQLFHIPVCLE